jgi:putative ABC transport system permease protein
MFFFTYLARELRRRLWQAIFIVLGLAIGVGLVLTVTAASVGVKNAQSDVLEGLYGVGTDITVTGTRPPAPPGGGGHVGIESGPDGPQMCVSGVCHALKNGYTIDGLGSPSYWPISDTAVSKVAAMKDVTAAAGGVLLTDDRTTISSNLPLLTSFTLDGADISQLKLGPLSDAAVSSGRAFTASDADKDVAVVDQGYAASNGLKVGGTMKFADMRFTIIGLVEQPEGSSPPDVYIPLARAQTVTGQDPVAAVGSMKNDVNMIYVSAASAADIATVQSEIAKLLPTAQITTPSSLAAQVTGSLTSAAKLAGDLGKWLSVLVLIAAFAVAVLLTVAAVARRVREFGTLKALGWPGRRIVAQVMGESLVVGILGAAVGVGLGYAAVAVINAIAPKLSATLTQPTGMHIVSPNGVVNPTTAHAVSVPLSAAVGGTATGLAVALALVGALLAGAFGSWRIGRLRPADAIAKVGLPWSTSSPACPRSTARARGQSGRSPARSDLASIPSS